MIIVIMFTDGAAENDVSSPASGSLWRTALSAVVSSSVHPPFSPDERHPVSITHIACRPLYFTDCRDGLEPKFQAGNVIHQRTLQIELAASNGPIVANIHKFRMSILDVVSPLFLSNTKLFILLRMFNYKCIRNTCSFFPPVDFRIHYRFYLKLLYTCVLKSHLYIYG